ncbi:translation initiation factor eIF-2B subunit family protein [Aspergillus nomiae NRRL 13137]|uniref:Translation initiation factor eIF-2B subunit family protein n=1 Tax=Aspergillus nomiae NRRL (strain ATCC 15546 / NRRL 13137 / CBS 260.88 / M93) TaxID=1509407 RepID=A0A0L1IVK0_ASPN3|nr:translation initiation factor eIF-2B subunit family protein [Aspergillus nomiae NRRL 13137]KNG83596.1 translation initiation factor eIF-2B subunit family protein [Aspergillus nomiae NRRL 13137]
MTLTEMATQGQGSQETQQSQSMTKRAVVSSFIFRFPPGQSTKPSVALFKRSEKVRTYRHHLAPISGSIDPSDPDPLAAAWRELCEETSLTPSDLSFWRTGKPFTFSDPSIGREWTIHPFAFRLKDPAEGGRGEEAIRTDWEHEGWQWYDPRAVLGDESLNTVPRLQDSLRRVWFEGTTNERAGKALAAGLERLRADHESGAHELTAIALTVFRDFIVYTQNHLDAEWWDMVRMAAWHLVKNGRESMGAATQNAVLSVLAEIEEIMEQKTGAEQKWDRILALIDFHLRNRTDTAQQVKNSFISYLQCHFSSSGTQKDRLTMLTISSSSTIRDSILEAYDALKIQTLELRVLESRPLFEGASLASSILSTFKSQSKSPDKHLHITMYTDASAALAARDVDIILLGADRISATKGVSNKTGSLPLVLSAKYVTPGVRVVVLSNVEKINGTAGVIDDGLAEGNDPFEVSSSWRSDGVKGVQVLENGMRGTKSEQENSSVTVANTYFEWVPLEMVDAFICEEGVLHKDSIQEKTRNLREKTDRYFGSL